MIISALDNGKTIYTSYRNKGKLVTNLEKFIPYFYISVNSKRPTSYKPSKFIERDFVYEEGEWYNLEGTKLIRVYVECAKDIKIAKKSFLQTYEADVPLAFRFAVDKLATLPEYKMRKWYWDMEWQQGGQYHDCITTIVMYDNYDERYYQWVWFPENTQRNLIYDVTSTFTFKNEKDMLENFMQTIQDKNPDMLISWFGNFADVPKLLERACALGLNPLVISPVSQVKGVVSTKNGYKFLYSEKGFGSIEQPIKGRITLNLDMAFERQWNDSQRGTLPSLSLDYVSELVLNRKKLVSEKFPDPNEFYRRAWLEDTETYLKYALVDVELMVELDELNYCSEAIIALQRLLIAPFDACFYASHMGSIYFMRNATWIAPTGEKVEKRQEYDGAMIYDPLSEETNGLHLNVAAFDFAGLYPSMMIARNISWETKSEEPTEFGVNILTPRDFSITDREQMLYYKTDNLGLLPKAVLELKELRNEYKRLMKEARENGDKNEYVKWYNNQMAVKRLMASFYGIVAFQGFGWADVDLAASITASAREAIRLAAFKAKGME